MSTAKYAVVYMQGIEQDQVLCCFIAVPHITTNLRLVITMSFLHVYLTLEPRLVI